MVFSLECVLKIIAFGFLVCSGIDPGIMLVLISWGLHPQPLFGGSVPPIPAVVHTPALLITGWL